MLTARRLREENIAEYVLYMWQTEDLLRAFGCDEGRIGRELAPRLRAGGGADAELLSWYDGLCGMMRREGVTLKGHLRANRDAVDALGGLSARLLRSGRFPRYRAAFSKAAVHLAEVRRRGGMEGLSDVEACLNVLYGIALLKMQKKEISPATAAAARDIAAAIGLLAAYYKKDKQEPLDF